MVGVPRAGRSTPSASVIRIRIRRRFFAAQRCASEWPADCARIGKRSATPGISTRRRSRSSLQRAAAPASHVVRRINVVGLTGENQGASRFFNRAKPSSMRARERGSAAQGAPAAVHDPASDSLGRNNAARRYPRRSAVPLAASFDSDASIIPCKGGERIRLLERLAQAMTRDGSDRHLARVHPRSQGKRISSIIASYRRTRLRNMIVRELD